jgi:hypothetical protein
MLQFGNCVRNTHSVSIIGFMDEVMAEAQIHLRVIEIPWAGSPTRNLIKMQQLDQSYTTYNANQAGVVNHRFIFRKLFIS